MSPSQSGREHTASLPRDHDPAAASLTLNAFLGLTCHWAAAAASEWPLLQKNGMGWGGLRWCPPHLLLPKVVMGLFLNPGRKYLLFAGTGELGGVWNSPEAVLCPCHHGESPRMLLGPDRIRAERERAASGTPGGAAPWMPQSATNNSSSQTHKNKIKALAFYGVSADLWRNR